VVLIGRREELFMAGEGRDGKRPRSIKEQEDPSPGVLTDREICEAAGQGRLIAENFRAANVQQACYELRVGSIYYDLSDGARRYVLGPEHRYVLLKPHQLIVVITKESLRLPPDVVGRILMKGKLFSLGLQPVNTYADPGFAGRLGIVIHNSSPSYIKLEEGESVAKIEFERLRKPVEHPYSGQHGYQTEIWPIPTHLILSARDLRGDARVGSPGEELRRAYGEELGTVVDRVFRYEPVWHDERFSAAPPSRSRSATPARSSTATACTSPVRPASTTPR